MGKLTENELPEPNNYSEDVQRVQLLSDISSGSAKYVTLSNGDLAVRVTIAGIEEYVVINGAVPTEDISPALTQSLQETMHDAITATATSAPIDISTYNKVTIQSVSAVTATIEIEVSLDGTNFVSIDTLTNSDIGQVEGKWKYVRTDVTAVSGALSVFLMAGN